MFDFLKDPTWIGVFTLAAVLAGVLVPVTLHLMGRRRKFFSYTVKSNTALLSVSEEIKPRIQILLDGHPVQDVRLVLVRLGNSGNIEIVPNDFYEPVSVSFGRNAQILEAEVVETKPNSLKPSLKIDKNTVILTPVLLNSGDEITLKVLGHKLGTKVTVQGRIKGVTEFTSFVRHITYWSLVKDLVTDTGAFVPLYVIGAFVGLMGLARGQSVIMSLLYAASSSVLLVFCISMLLYIILVVIRWQSK